MNIYFNKNKLNNKANYVLTMLWVCVALPTLKTLIPSPYC